MQRNRLKNIVNKSKTLNQKIEPFDAFKKSLPKEIEIGDNYRLEAAWKAYGSPKNYQEALWLGLIQPIDENNVKLPSIGYNEETDEYEYLNSGKDNETVAKDIRVWDNDVIPLVQELKLGGYVRTFSEEKNCWTYSKNSLKRIESSEDNELQVIDSFLKGGKSDKKEVPDFFEMTPEGDYLYWNDDNRALDFIKNNKWFRKQYKLFGEPKDGEKTRLVTKKRFEKLWWELNKSKVFNELIKENDLIGDGWLSEYKYKTLDGKVAKLALDDDGELMVDEKGNLLYETVDGNLYTDAIDPQAFKQGGQMNVIPEGALHARKNEMELAKEGTVTHKGIPVVDDEGKQQAEIERNEIIFNKEVTEKLENYCKQFNSNDKSQSEKDEIAIKAGKLLAKQIIENTDDRTGLIEEVANKE